MGQKIGKRDVQPEGRGGQGVEERAGGRFGCRGSGWCSKKAKGGQEEEGC